MAENNQNMSPLLGIQMLLMIIGFIGSIITVAVTADHLDVEVYNYRMVSAIMLSVGFVVIMYYYIQGYKLNDKLFVLPILCLTVCLLSSLIHNFLRPLADMQILVVVMIVAVILSLLPLFFINKVRFVIFCFATICAITVLYTGYQLIFVVGVDLLQSSATFITKLAGVMYWLSIPIMSFSILFCYTENTKRKAQELGESKWISRGDGTYWKFR